MDIICIGNMGAVLIYILYICFAPPMFQNQTMYLLLQLIVCVCVKYMYISCASNG